MRRHREAGVDGGILGHDCINGGEKNGSLGLVKFPRFGHLAPGILGLSFVQEHRSGFAFNMFQVNGDVDSCVQ